jgi:splicing factor 3B subunit 1
LGNLTPDRLNLLKYDNEVAERNKPLTDDELDRILPKEGYELIKPPEGYKPISTPTRKLLSTPTPYGQTPLYNIPDTNTKPYDIQSTPSHLGVSGMKPEDISHFQALLSDVDESKLTPEELRDRNIMTLLLKIKNGTPPIRKSALRQITEKAREFGAGPLFNQILPLLMSPTLEDQERHLLVKVIDRILYKLDELVRPYVHKILVVIEPLLIDEDYYARIEGREIISNLAKAAGLATMISTMRPDIDHSDEFVRNTTARAFAVVASALGIPSILPFLKAVCQSKKSWQARHTGIKIIQQIAILMGCAILPYLRSLVEIVENGLKDDQQKVRTMTALCIAALAEASYPYGIEAFGGVIKHLFEGMKLYKGKGLAAFFKAIGFIIPLMDSELSARSTRLIIPILRKNFETPDDEMKKIILKVLKQCIGTEGVEASFVRNEILPDFLKYFWTRRMALDRKNYKQLIETTVEIASKIGGGEVIERIIDGMKDESEPYRKMTIETIEKIVSLLGVADIGSRLELLMVEGLNYCINYQSADDANLVLLSGFGAITTALGLRLKPHIANICGTVKMKFDERNAKMRQLGAELIARIASVMKTCGEENLLGVLGTALYENLGEEYPEVLASILAALKAVVMVIGMSKMNPPIRDLLPRLTPILKNRHEKVQENCIDLIGRIAERGASFVSAKEWMRICFDLLDLLKAQRKSIRRACINTFGYIAKAIGPQDVLVTLLNNLKVQERQNRVCTTVAIAIVSETCGPYTVVPALMNEYRVPELNVQNGVLKSFSFLFEYVGEMSKDYVYSVLPLLEDALTDRDLVHRQTAAAAIKHLALGVTGLNCEDALVHLLNFLWPNIFETSPHVINAVMEAVEGMRVGLGANRMLTYVLQGLFHPARRVRDVYWKIFNMLYVGGADDLVAAYPQLPDDNKQSYRRTELELFI